MRAWVVPGSEKVKRAAEAEGLDRIFRDAGFEWREPGCSMCLAANGELAPRGARVVSTSNRNFEGRQGPGARTHLASPAMAAARCRRRLHRRRAKISGRVMEKFTVLTGVAAYLPKANVNTDILIRIERLMHVPKRQLARYCFEAWRYRPDGSDDPGFVLNQPAYARRQDIARRAELRLRQPRAKPRCGRCGTSGSAA